MFKLVVLSALFAVSMAAPSGIHAVAPVAYSVAAPAVAVPTAVSHQSRVDVHSSPVVATTYTAQAPVAVAAAPVAVAAPAVVEARYAAPAVAVPTAVSHQSRVDVHSKPVVATTYSAHVPAVATYAAHVPAVASYAAHVPAAYASYAAHVPAAYASVW